MTLTINVKANEDLESIPSVAEEVMDAPNVKFNPFSAEISIKRTDNRMENKLCQSIVDIWLGNRSKIVWDNVNVRKLRKEAENSINSSMSIKRYLSYLLFGLGCFPNYVFTYSEDLVTVMMIMIECILRSFGQVVFCNNPISGLIIAISLFVADPMLGFFAVISVMFSNIVALIVLKDLSNPYLRNGLAGYNQCLLGIAVYVFANPTGNVTLLMYLPVSMFFCVFAFILHNALGNMFGTKYEIPALTNPFNISMLFFFSALTIFNQVFKFVPVSGNIFDKSTGEAENGSALFIAFLTGTIKGFGQVFLCDNIITSVLIIIGMYICSPLVTWFALVGSFFASLFSHLIGVSTTAIAAGVMGFNPVLGAASISIFFVPSVTSFIFSIFVSIMCVVTHGVILSGTLKLGIPAMTIPFCITAFICLFVRKNIPSLISIPLIKVSRPEDHLTRYELTKNIVLRFKKLIKISANNTLGANSPLQVVLGEEEDEDISLLGGNIVTVPIDPLIEMLLLTYPSKYYINWEQIWIFAMQEMFKESIELSGLNKEKFRTPSVSLKGIQQLCSSCGYDIIMEDIVDITNELKLSSKSKSKNDKIKNPLFSNEVINFKEFSIIVSKRMQSILVDSVIDELLSLLNEDDTILSSKDITEQLNSLIGSSNVITSEEVEALWQIIRLQETNSVVGDV